MSTKIPQDTISDVIKWWENDLTSEQREKLLPKGWPEKVEERHFVLLQFYLNHRYGKSQKETDLVGVSQKFKLGKEYKFKDGTTSRLAHIEFRNMAVDLLYFANGKELFSGDIVKNLDLKGVGVDA